MRYATATIFEQKIAKIVFFILTFNIYYENRTQGTKYVKIYEGHKVVLKLSMSVFVKWCESDNSSIPSPHQ
jgi:hypothetical protein